MSASSISYGDCKSLQIVCPACRDAVFKVERDSGNNITHFLSHYKAIDKTIEDCELRVKSISTAEVTENNNLARKQRLEYFLRVFKDIVNNHYHQRHILAKPEDKWEWFNKSYGLRLLYNKVRNKINKDGIESVFKREIKEFESSISEQSYDFTTTLPKTYQLRIAHDIWITLNRASNSCNLKLLFNHAYNINIMNYVMSDTINDEYVALRKNIKNILPEIIDASTEIGANRLVNDMDPQIYKVIANITLNRMVSELCTFHYAEALRKEYGDEKIEYPDNPGLKKLNENAVETLE